MLGAGLGTPKFKKSKLTSAKIPAVTSNGKNVTTGVKAFGRICFRIILKLETPIDFADLTYSGVSRGEKLQELVDS